MLRTDALDYHLPPDRIATHPVVPRDSARLLLVRRSRLDAPPEHLSVRDLPDLLESGDRVVFNTTRVLPARFLGRREDTGGGVQGLFLEDDPEPGVWIALVRSRRHRPGARVRLALRAGGDSRFSLEMLGPVADPPGAWRLRLHADGGSAPAPPEVLAEVGLAPLPPYILAARKAVRDAGDDAADLEQYQTVYADEPAAASVAAPTAGLHFTPGLLGRLASTGVDRTEVVLHVGAGTFKPVETELVEEHPIHAEWCSMSPEAVAEVERTRRAGGRVIAVGTTSVRTLESYAPLRAGGEAPESLSTRLLITPGFAFGWTDALMTNFHLPRSTLMSLVAAMLQQPGEPHQGGEPPGVTRLKRLYAEAVARGYRFYSFGDAMLIL